MADNLDTFVRSVTTRLRELRKASGVTGEQLAERLGIAVQNLRRIEAGQNLTLKMDAIVGIRGATIGRRAELSPLNETISQQIIQHDDRGERDRSAAEVGDRLQPRQSPADPSRA